MLRLAIVFLALSATAAFAQPATESVTATSLKAAPPQVVDRFIETFAAPTYTLNKLSRWEEGICPVAAGLPAPGLTFILQRLKDNAAKVGAPVSTRARCRTNIEIVFTTTPQGLMDNVRKDHVAFLGYASGSAAADRLAKVKHDIQAWYTTAAKDIHGFLKIDNSRSVGLSAEDVAFALGAGTSWGWHTRDGQSSTLYNVIVAVNPDKLGDREIGGIADYISFVVLSQVISLDRCQALPSIVNMQVPDCPAQASELTEADLAFLRGLYRMPPGNNLREQKSFIRYEMMAGSDRERER